MSYKWTIYSNGYVCDSSYTSHDALIYVTWLIHIYDVTHWCICDDSWISVTWRTRMHEHFIFVNEDLLCIWHDTLMYVKWLIHVRDVRHCCMWDDSFANASFYTYMNSAWMHHVTNMKMTHSRSRHESFIFRQCFLVFRMKHKRKKETWEIFFGLHVIRMDKWVPCHTYGGHSLIFPLFFSPTQSNFHIFFIHEWMSTRPFFQGTQTFWHVFVFTHSWMCECPVTRMNKWLLPMSHNISHTYEGVKACLDVTHMRRECFSSLWMKHVTHVNEWVPCHIYEWMSASHVTQFMSHIWMVKWLSAFHTQKCVGASLRCEWVMSHVGIRKHQRICFQVRTRVPMRHDPHVTLWWQAVYCSVLLCIAVCCSVLQCVAVCCSVLWRPWMKKQRRDNPHVTLCGHAARSCP